MRKKLSIKNSIAGLINKLVSITFVFIVRHFFVDYLDSEYLGLEGLFGNVLGLFSLVDLGLGQAISFSLYEPLHNNDQKTLSAIMRLYKRLYILIGGIVFGMALCFSPFIVRFIKDNTLPENEIRLVFLVYAFGVAVTYLFSYKRTLIFAMQKNYIVLNVDTATKILLSVLQIIAIIKFRNYTIYLALVVLINLLGNIIISCILEKQKQYNNKIAVKLPQTIVDRLKTHVKALAVTNVAWQCISSTDNIIISDVVGVLDLAKNANYTTIVSSINSIFSVMLGGVSASIGDLLVEGDLKKSKEYFDRYCFIYVIVSAYAALGVYYISKSVIILWVGSKLLFDDITVLLISANLFLALNFKPIAEYQNFSGNFVHYKPYSIIAVFINLIVSVFLGKRIGINGVFIGTTVTYVYMIICVASILSKYLFNNTIIDYFKHLLIAMIPMFISIIIIHICKIVLTEEPIRDLILSFAIVSGTYFGAVFIVLRKNKQFIFYKDMVVKIFKNKSIKEL